MLIPTIKYKIILRMINGEDYDDLVRYLLLAYLDDMTYYNLMEHVPSDVLVFYSTLYNIFGLLDILMILRNEPIDLNSIASYFYAMMVHIVRIMQRIL